ncbi:MAG: LpxL/LpxP family Kdo(2)-lipid IV(A) lauroyl/palmitoleoyl acyltransferase [Pseudomonadota bacterium]
MRAYAFRPFIVTDTPPAHPRFLSPRYWPTWLVLGLMWCLAQLPFRAQMTLGRGLGRLLNIVGGRRRHIAEVNLRLCLPELNENERRRILSKHLESVGLALVETAMSWFTPTEKLRPRVQVEGLEHLQAAYAQGKGAIVLMGHFTTMELIARLMAMHTPLHATYRQHKNPLYQHFQEAAHRRYCAAIVPHTDMRAMYRALQKNQALWYAPDQNYAGKLSGFAPFFGVPAATITATSRIAQTSGAPVIPLLAQRLPGAAGYRLTLQPPLADYPSGDLIADATRINQTIEAQVRHIPEQYLWVHRRFKTRPPGEPDVYR